MDIVRIMNFYNVDNINIKIRMYAQNVLSNVVHAHHYPYVRVVQWVIICIKIHAIIHAQLLCVFSYIMMSRIENVLLHAVPGIILKKRDIILAYNLVNHNQDIFIRPIKHAI